jgi:predicted secreted hydrolase
VILSAVGATFCRELFRLRRDQELATQGRSHSFWLLLLLAMMLLVACKSEPPTPPERPTLTRTLGTATGTGFDEITAPLNLQFPRDHGAHPHHRVEWWYVTARLQAADGRRFGAQFALFRYALRPEDVAMRQDWRSGQIYLAHAAITDIDGQRFRFDEQSARGAAGVAGAEHVPFRAWLGDCSIGAQSASAFLPLRLKCGGSDFGYDLVLSGADTPVLHGEQGYSQKSDQGSASAYYSYPQLSASGELWIDATRHQVSGKAWYDHEWTSGVLADDQVGWDWFSLRLSDGSALMLFNIRRADGSLASRRGTLIEADGSVRALAECDVDVRPNGDWTSPHSGVRWPLRWTLSSKSLDLQLDIVPVRDDQEFDGAVRYWEGAIDASGQRNGKSVRAEGYLELTGYE